MTEYLVVVTREGDSWLANVPAVNAQTFARALPQLDAYVREAITVATGLPAVAGPELVLKYDYRVGDADRERRRLAGLRDAEIYARTEPDAEMAAWAAWAASHPVALDEVLLFHNATVEAVARLERDPQALADYQREAAGLAEADITPDDGSTR